MRTRSRQSPPSYFTLSHFSGIPAPCQWRDTKGKNVEWYEVITDDPSGRKSRNGIRISYPEKPVDHFKVTFKPSEVQQMQAKNSSAQHCGWYETQRVLGGLVAPLPFTLEYLQRITVGSPPNPSAQDVEKRMENPFGNNLFETVASLKDVRGLVTQMEDLGQVLKHMPKSLRWLGRKNPKRFWRNVKQVPRAAASAYLSNEFAWKQTGSDVARIIAFVQPMLDHLKKLNEGAGKPQRMSFTDTYTQVFAGTGYKVTCNFVTRRTYKYVYRYTGSTFLQTLDSRLTEVKVTKALRQITAFWGLNPSIGGMWDLFPASWVIDQFVPIGDFLDDIRAKPTSAMFQDSLELQYLGGTTSSKCTFKIEYTFDYWRTVHQAPEWYWRIPDPVTFTASGTHYVRSKAIGSPPGFSLRRRGKTKISPTAKVYLGLTATKGL